MDVIAGHFSSQVSRMSIDFDSAALQTQQEEEEYDQEDYAREQEVSVQLLNTDSSAALGTWLHVLGQQTNNPCICL